MEELLQMIEDGPGTDITEDPYIIESYEYIAELLRQACIALHTKLMASRLFGMKDGKYLQKLFYQCIVDVMQQNELTLTQLSQNYPNSKLQYLKGKKIVIPLLDIVIRKKVETEADKVNFAAIYVRKASDPESIDVRTIKSDMARLAYLVINEGCRFAFYIWVGTLEEIRWMDMKTQVAIPHPDYRITEVCINKHLDLIPRVGKPIPHSIAKTIILNQITPECCVRLYRIEPDLISPHSHDLDEVSRIDQFYRELHHFKYDVDSHSDLLADLRLRIMRAKDYWEAKLVDYCDAALTSLRVIMAELLYTKALDKKEQAELAYLQKHYYYIDQFLYEDNVQRMMKYENDLLNIGNDEIELLRIRVNCFRYDSDYHLMTLNQTTLDSLDQDPRPISPSTQKYYNSIKPRSPPPSSRERKNLLPILESLKDWQKDKYPIGVFRPKSHTKVLENIKRFVPPPSEDLNEERLKMNQLEERQKAVIEDSEILGLDKSPKTINVGKSQESDSGAESDSSRKNATGKKKKKVKKMKTVLKEKPLSKDEKETGNREEEKGLLESGATKEKKKAKKKKITTEVISVAKIVSPHLDKKEKLDDEVKKTLQPENLDTGSLSGEIKGGKKKKKIRDALKKKGIKIRGKKKKKKKSVTELERSTLSPVQEASEPDSDYY